ncbi:PREDICTED: venom allergen 3-like [Vollenhovia emeryi]|uniref:venom allergen 3-like n=1 Tax=Vollenhovia emeryi TaxID=411798 RepID=UPI0005F3F0AC|nr:PREDICTED: venom allergen 3-like [Vollenhovia emeryi]
MALIFNILFLVIVTENFAGTFATDYCKLKSCEEKGIHTMCTYTSPKPAKACKEWSDQGFSDAERKAIVDKHNQLRQKVASGKEKRGSNGPQPAAVRMPDLTWDKELETIAQRWANQCNYDHDDCNDVERFEVGQNIAEESSSNKDDTSVDDMIQSWYDEVADFDKRVLSSFA